MNSTLLLLALVPITIGASFFIHWLTLVKIKAPDERLPFCRGAYLAMSFQLVLYAWIVFMNFGDSAARFLIPLGISFSFIGDLFNLQFPKIKEKFDEPVFGGIISFFIAQVFYIWAFLTIVPAGELVSDGYLYYFLGALIVFPAVVFRFRVYNPERPKKIMYGALVYGFILGAMTAVALSAAIVHGGFWYAVAAGALFFLLSDAVMGETTIYGRHPSFEYQVPWVTYLLAQGLIVFGTGGFLV